MIARLFLVYMLHCLIYVSQGHQNVMDEAFEKPVIINGRYKNPPSFTTCAGFPTFSNILKWKLTERSNFTLPSTTVLEEFLPVKTPNFNHGSSLAFTWLGHATAIVQLDNATFVTDPVFAAKASPFGIGFNRYRPLPCRIEDIPQVDFGVISHNHYDHLDANTVRNFNNHFKDMRWYVPLGLKDFMVKNGAKRSNVREMNWGDRETVTFNGNEFNIWCVPSQHWSQRSVFDRDKVLWSGWAVLGPTKRFYFAGDTGYCENEFKKIGAKLGPFDLAAIPIGAYLPRYIMQTQHVNPEEAVQIHKHVRAKKSIAIHWGTYDMGSSEGYLEPKETLKQESKKADLKADEFVTVYQGDTWTEAKG